MARTSSLPAVPVVLHQNQIQIQNCCVEDGVGVDISGPGRVVTDVVCEDCLEKSEGKSTEKGKREKEEWNEKGKGLEEKGKEKEGKGQVKGKGSGGGAVSKGGRKEGSVSGVNRAGAGAGAGGSGLVMRGGRGATNW